MRKISQLLMHDSAVQLVSDGPGWTDFHDEKYELGYDLREWLDERISNVFTKPLPNELAIERVYSTPSGLELLDAQGEVKGYGVIDLNLRWRSMSGDDEWTEEITYCGNFTVWWA